MADDELQVARAPDGAVRILRSLDRAGKFIQVIAAGEHQRIFDGVQSLTLTGVALALTVPSGATHALVYADSSTATDFCRYWQDGTAPTAAIGKKLVAHEELACASPGTFKAINSTGAIVLRIEYYHYG
jgi:hypothetical protein